VVEALLRVVLNGPDKTALLGAEGAADHDVFLQIDPDGASAFSGGGDPFAAGEPVILRHEETPAPQVKGHEFLWWGKGFPTERFV
jgi:hypothetical protein